MDDERKNPRRLWRRGRKEEQASEDQAGAQEARAGEAPSIGTEPQEQQAGQDRGFSGEEEGAKSGPEVKPPPRMKRSLYDIEHQCLDLCPICRAADVVRATIPPEAQEHWQAWQREALLGLRSLLDYYLERLDQEKEQGPGLQDIPIE